MTTPTKRTPDYNSVMTTVMCAILIWFGSQVVDLTVKLTKIETDVVNIRQQIQESNGLRRAKETDYETRLRALEQAIYEQKTQLQG